MREFSGSDNDACEMTDNDRIIQFVDAATSDLQKAEELLGAHPELTGGGFHVWLVLGDSLAVAKDLSAYPELATAPGGHSKCVPLVYTCFSRYGSAASGRSSGIVETARVLLRHGADPNAAFTPEDLPDNPLSCLYAATGMNNNPELARVLLEAGAKPNDGESLYHSTEHADFACLKLLLQYGATPQANELKHMLDREERNGLQLLLDAGADPNLPNERGETALHWAVWRGRSAASVQTLLDRGAAIDAKRHDGRTAYALAILGGQSEIAMLLERCGASTEMPPLNTPGSERLLPDLTQSHRTEAVRELLAAGIPVDTRGEAGGTALHWACWKGYADIAELLLERGASTAIEDTMFHATAAGWYEHGKENCGEGDYEAVAQVLKQWAVL